MKKKMIFLFMITTLFFFTFTTCSLAMANIQVKATNPSEKEYQKYQYDVRCEKGEYTFSVEPGVYKLRAYYMETGVSYSKIIENIKIGDNQKIDKEIYFEKGFIQVKATDNDGWANTRYYIDKYNPSE